MFFHDDRIVITLDAGGTNLVFGAMRGCEYITEPVTYPSNVHDLDLCLDTMEYDDMNRVGVTFSKLGAGKAISAGAYAFALSKIDEKEG